MPRAKKKVEGVYEKNPGSGVWYARLRVNGKLVRKAIGTHKDAVAYIEKARTVRRTGDGVVPLTARRPVRTFAEIEKSGDGTTLGDICDMYLKWIASDGNPAGLVDLVNPPQRVGVIKAEFGDRPAASLLAHEITDWLEGMGLAPATRNRYKSTLSAVYKFAKKRLIVKDNPCHDVEHYKVELPNPRFMDETEEDRLRAVVQGWIDETPEHHRMTRLYLREHLNEITVAAGTGLRKGNQYALTFPMLDFAARLIHVPRTKNGEPHTVPMIDDVYEALLDQQRIQDEIAKLGHRTKVTEKTKRVASDGRVFSIKENREWFDKARMQAKLKDLCWHQLSRHTAGSRLAQSGANLVVIRDVLGHKTLAMAARYSHLNKSVLAESMRALNRKTA